MFEKIMMFFMQRLSDSAKIGLLLFAILLFGGLLFGLFSWMLYKLQWWNLLIFVVFAAWMALSSWLNSRTNGRVMNVISNIVSAPIAVVYLLMGLVHPFITIVGAYLFVAMFGFGVPALIITGLNKVFEWGLRPETIGFVVMAGGSILCANSYNLTKWMVRHSPIRNFGEHRYEDYRERLAQYVIHPSNVIFVLYLLYFLFLAITGFMQIQFGGSLTTPAFDAAVLKAFLVFIAFTNMRSKAKDAELDSKDLLKQTLGLFVHDEE